MELLIAEFSKINKKKMKKLGLIVDLYGIKVEVDPQGLIWFNRKRIDYLITGGDQRVPYSST